MKKLQVLIDSKWKYVFCRNELKALPITTENKSKAIRGNDNSLNYFSSKYASLDFKIV